MIWLTGGGLVMCLFMIVGLLSLVLINGASTFWPMGVRHIVLNSGQVVMGPVTRIDTFTPSEAVLEAMAPESLAQAQREMAANDGQLDRRLVRSANYDITNEHFTWVTSAAIRELTYPQWAVTVERQTWGRFFGYPRAVAQITPLAGVENAADHETRLAEARTALADAPDGRVLVTRFEEGEQVPVFVTLDAVQPGDTIEGVTTDIAVGEPESWARYQELHGQARANYRKINYIEKYELGRLNTLQNAARQRMRVVALTEGEDSPAHVEAQQVFEQRVAELAQEREQYQEQIDELKAVNESKVFLMETAQGVPVLLQIGEIVRAFPANQLGFFDKVGVYLSRWFEFLTADPREANSEGGVFPVIFGTVFMVLIMTILVVPFGVLAALYIREYAKAGPVISVIRIAINNLAGVPSIVYGVFGLGFFCYIVGAGIDDVFFPVAASDGNPVFGKTALIWASFTLALLTLPVVIVATEEALSAVPNSMREGSYACGASKWQTIKRIVLPRALPGIMTGMILAMARGAGEVAPLMVVGAVKLAPELPFSIYPSEQFGINRSFMHLGFHIYDLGFQSQNSEAAKPMVYTTTLLLITIVIVMNITAIYLRNRLRKKFVSGAF